MNRPMYPINSFPSLSESISANAPNFRVGNRIRGMTNARLRGNSQDVSRIAANLSLSDNPDPKGILPLVRKRLAKEYA